MHTTICKDNHLSQQQFDSQQIIDNTALCFNSQCIPKSEPTLKILICNQCLKKKTHQKNGLSEHEDHMESILTLDQIIKQLTTMIIRPQKMAKDYLHRAATALHKFQVITQIREKIENVEGQIQRQILEFLDETQTLINQCSQIKDQMAKLTEKTVYINDYNDLEKIIQTIYGNLQISNQYLETRHDTKHEKHDNDKNIKNLNSKQKNKNACSKLVHKKLPKLKESNTQSQDDSDLSLTKWEQRLKNINQCYEMFRDYAIKIVEACTVQSSDQQDDFRSNFAASSKLYRKLQTQIKDKVKNDSQSHTVKHSRTFNDTVQNQFTEIKTEHTQKRSQKKLDISLQTQFSYEHKEKKRGLFHRNPLQQQDLLTPRKEINRLKKVFQEPYQQDAEKGEKEGVNKLKKEARRKEEKKVMFEKILDIYQYNYQDSEKSIPKTINQKPKYFVRH